MKIRNEEGLTFNDVLLIPKQSTIEHRTSEYIDLTSKVSRNYTIDLPFIAANMDTVCEQQMALAIARVGGLGVIHRNMTIEEQSKQIKSLKQIMPNYPAAAAIGLDAKYRVEALEAAGADILVLDIAHGDHVKTLEIINSLNEQFPNRKWDLIIGNIATKLAGETFFNEYSNGRIDGIKVGVGPGSACTTRIVTGHGVPQLTAIIEVVKVVGEMPVIADGGLKTPGDVVKALAAGASTVMMGNVFAHAIESPGWIPIDHIMADGMFFNDMDPITIPTKWKKTYRGMASFGNRTPEGITTELVSESKPPAVRELLSDFIGGLYSGMSYSNARTLEELHLNAEFIKISSASWNESTPHILN